MNTTQRWTVTMVLLGVLLLWIPAPSQDRLGVSASEASSQLRPHSALTLSRLSAAGVAVSPSVCQPWQVVAQPPKGSLLTGVAAVSTHDVWAVGSTDLSSQAGQPLIEHWNGAQWRVVPSPHVGTGDALPTSGNLIAVAAVSAHDVWAVGELRSRLTGSQWQGTSALIEHWDGHRWQTVPSPDTAASNWRLYGVAATSAHDVWAVGTTNNNWQAGPLILHWNGRQWTDMDAPNPSPGGYQVTLNAVAAVAPDDVWAVGGGSDETDFLWSGNAVAEHWDGHSWQLVQLPDLLGGATGGSRLDAVVAVSSHDVWAGGGIGDPRGGTGPALLHWDGQQWSSMPSPQPGLYNSGGISALAAVSPRVLWQLGQSPDDVRLSGTPYSAFWDGQTWYPLPGPAPRAFAVVGTHDIWGVGATIVHYSGPSCYTNPVLATLPARLGGASMAVLPRGGRAVVSDYDGTVNVVDTIHGQIVATATATMAQRYVRTSLAGDDQSGHILVAAAEDNVVRFLDGATAGVLTTTAVGVYPQAVAVAPAARHALVLNANNDKATCYVQGWPQWHCHSLGPASVSVLDLASAKVLTTTQVGPNPSQLVVDDRAGRAYVADDGGVHVLDTRSGELVETAPITGVTSIAVDAALGRVFVGVVTSDNTYRLYDLDAQDGRIVQAMDLPVAPQSIAMAEPDRLFVVGSGSIAGDYHSLLVMIHATDGHILKTTDVAGGPTAVGVDAGSGRVFVASWTNTYYLDGSPNGPGAISIFDMTTLAPLAAFPIEDEGPQQIAVDPIAHRVLVDGTVILPSNPPSSLAIPEVPPTRQSSAPCCGSPEETRVFTETGHTLSGPFFSFWRAYGGLDIFGYPRTEPFVENAHWQQYTDRFALEMDAGVVHPLPLGSLLIARRTVPRVVPFPNTPQRQYFASTGHSLSGLFLAYWQRHHGDLLLGAPIAEPDRETNGDGTGHIYLVQWFTNGRLEYHPELAGTHYEVEIGLCGKQALHQRGWLP